MLLRVPFRQVALVVSPDHARRVLDESPEPFATANREKRAALSHFQPDGVLISHGPVRADRRRFNEEVLDTGRPIHRLGNELAAKVAQEADGIRAAAMERGALGWDEFADGWWRMVRRVVLGDSARDDHGLTDLLASLSRDANWAFLRPKRKRLRERVLARLQGHMQTS